MTWGLRAICAVLAVPVGWVAVRFGIGVLQDGIIPFLAVPLFLLTLALILMSFAAFGGQQNARRYLSAALLGGVIVGSPAFLVGFVGPIILSSGNQGPLLGIFFTGPFGFVAGSLAGVAWARRVRRRGMAFASTAGPAFSLGRSILALLTGFVVLFVLGAAIEVAFFSVSRQELSQDFNAYFAFRNRALVVVATSLCWAAAGFMSGFLAARLAKRRPVIHGMVLGGIQGLYLSWGIVLSRGAGQMPRTNQVALLVLTVVGICSGALFFARTSRLTQPTG